MQASTTPRRSGTTAVHSLHRFVFSVPDLAKAEDFYRAFGLDVRPADARIDLHTFGHPHRWGSIYRGDDAKRLEYLSFAAYPDDYERLVKRLEERHVPLSQPHRLADEKGVWITDPEGVAIQIVVGDKASPAAKDGATNAVTSSNEKVREAIVGLHEKMQSAPGLGARPGPRRRL